MLVLKTNRTRRDVAFLRRALLASPLTNGLGALLLIGLTTTAASAQELPVGGTVASGSATIGAGGPGAATTTVTQSSNRAIINWQSFDVAAGKSVVFVQPDASSATLNRVTGGTSSTIAGQIVATGSVYLINPNGIAITASGNVQTGGGFVASTLDIADGDFNSGTLNFTGRGASRRVSNKGRITAGDGGYVALLGGTVLNSGTITVALGKVGLGSGETIALDLNGDGFMRVAVPTAALTSGNTALIEQVGSIAASGGRVELKAATVKDAVRNVINLSGNITADSATGNGGTIILLGGDGGTVKATGTLSAKATGATGTGGFVETSGATVDFAGLTVDTRSAGGAAGTWLIDPVDLTIDAAAAATISTNLGTGNVTVQTTATTATTPGVQSGTNGDIFINSAISWTSANTLSLLAYRNIALNAAITGTNGGLTLTAGNNVANTGAISATGAVNIGTFNLTNGNWSQNTATLPTFSATDFRFDVTKANFLRATGGDGSSGTPYQIADVYGLQGMASANTLANTFVLTNTIDASGTAGWNGGLGFVPIGTDGKGASWNGSAFVNSGALGFSGSLNGANFVVDRLFIARSTGAGAVGNRIGLFGWTSSGTISNLGTTNGTISGKNFVGGLVGYQASGTLRNVYSTNTVSSATRNVGGLVGDMASGTLSNSYATGAVAGAGGAGGLVGLVSGGSIANSYATGTVTATSGSDSFGGLIGLLNAATVTNVYATGAVVGGTANATSVGGLIGSSRGTVSFAYATGAVSGSAFVAGFIGALNGGSVDNAYSTGNVTQTGSGGQFFGGFVGDNSQGFSVTNAYWDTYASGQLLAFGAGSGGATAVTSDPSQSGNASYAYKAGAYANLTGASGVGTATPSGFAFVAGDTTRPFLAFEVPTGFTTTTSGGALQIVNSHQLQLIGYNAASNSGSYGLGNNINLAETGVNDGTAANSAGMWSPKGFVPLGSNGTDGTANVWNGTGYGTIASIAGMPGAVYGFGGAIDGNGFTLSNLSIRRPAATNMGLIGVSSGTVSNLIVLGTVSGFNGVGGLVGLQRGGTITNIISGVAVSGNNLVGGLVGNQPSGTITLSSAFGNVSGVADIGGLVGYQSGTVSRSFALGAASGQYYVGGLIGYGYNGTVANSYAMGSANAAVNVAGGLVGVLNGGSVTNGYSTGAVTAPTNAGGLIGTLGGGATVTSSYWNTQSSGRATSAGGTARTTAQMQDTANYATNFAGWDFAAIWLPPTSGTYPTLRKLP